MTSESESGSCHQSRSDYIKDKNIFTGFERFNQSGCTLTVDISSVSVNSNGTQFCWSLRECMISKSDDMKREMWHILKFSVIK